MKTAEIIARFALFWIAVLLLSAVLLICGFE
jgi:hypothetical protein